MPQDFFFKWLVPPAFMAPVVFIVWLVALWLVKRLVFYRLNRWAASTRAKWDDNIVKALSLPADLLIITSGLVISSEILSLPDKFDRFSKVLLQGCIVLIGVLIVDRVLNILLERYAHKGILSQMSHGLVKGILRGFVFVIGLLLFLDLLGISITPILASLGIGSLAVALALQDTLSNFFAGLYVAIDKPVEEGHFIKLESGDEGYVLDIGWRTTRIRTQANNVIVIPNAKLMGSVISNYYLPDTEIMVSVPIGVSYDSDLEKVEKVTLEVARQAMKASHGGQLLAEPALRFHTFGDFSVNAVAVLKAREVVEGQTLKHDFIKRLHVRYKQEGIVIPYPTRTVYTAAIE